MTVETSVASSGPYAGSGTTGPFTVAFYFLDDTHLRVVRTASGVETELVLNVDYTVAGAGSPGGGTVTLAAALASGQTLTILRDVPVTQLQDYVEADAFPAASHEQALDKLTMIAQQLSLAVNQALRVPEVAGTLPALPAASTRALRVLAFDANGNPMMIPGVDSSSAAALATDLANSADPAKGDALVAEKRTATGAVAMTRHAKAELEELTLEDFGGGTGVGDNAAAFALALAACVAQNKRVRLAAGTYTCLSDVSVPVGTVCPDIRGQGRSVTEILFSGTGAPNGLYYNGNASTFPYAGRLSNLTVRGTGGATRGITLFGVNMPMLDRVRMSSFAGSGLSMVSVLNATVLGCLWVGNGSATEAQIAVDLCTTLSFLNCRISGANGGTVAGVTVDRTPAFTWIGGNVESTGIPFKIASKADAVSGCRGGIIAGVDLEAPGLHYIEMGYGWTGTTGRACYGWTIDTVFGYTSGITDVRYGVKLKHTCGVEIRNCLWALTGGSLVTEHWLEGTTNDSLRITQAPRVAYGNSRPWVMVNGAMRNDASPLLDWKQEVVNVYRGEPSINGATPSILVSAAQGGVYDLAYVNNGGATNMTNLTGGAKNQSVILMASNGNTTIVHAGGGTGQFKNKTGANVVMAAGFGYHYVYDGAAWQAV